MLSYKNIAYLVFPRVHWLFRVNNISRNPTTGTEEDHKKLQDSWCPESRFEQGTATIQDYSVTARLTHVVN